jgi:hypothetical protein
MEVPVFQREGYDMMRGFSKKYIDYSLDLRP